MPRRTKPRWGFEETLNVADIQARRAQVDFAHVEDMVGGANPDAELPFDIELSWLLTNFYYEAIEDPAPSFAEMAAALRATRTAVIELRRCTAEMDYLTQRWLGPAILKAYRARMSERDETLRALARAAPWREEALTTLDFLLEVIDAVELPSEPSRRGRKPNRAMQGFIQRLADFYELHSGERALTGFYRNAIEDRYEGQLVCLAEYLLGAFVPDLHTTNASIGEHIRRTIGDRAAL